MYDIAFADESGGDDNAGGEISGGRFCRSAGSGREDRTVFAGVDERAERGSGGTELR